MNGTANSISPLIQVTEIDLDIADTFASCIFLGEKHTCPDCKVRKTRVRALHITDPGPPDCQLRLAEINSPEKKQERFEFLRLMNKIMGED